MHGDAGVRCHDLNGREIETYQISGMWFWAAARRVPRTDPHGPFVTAEDALENARVCDAPIGGLDSEHDGRCDACGHDLLDGRCEACAEVDQKIYEALAQEDT